ncbi:hypothetical protein [Aeromonas caviae]|uniref:hypothetical protein n=1 Tax=Aeromonas caviae TaxID=648 RepID=UPI0015D61BAD|nr:hypothetical protein [Aeromonas caviae]
MQRGECSGCGDPLPLRPCQPEQGPLRYRILGALASDNRFITTSLVEVGVGMVEQGALTPIPFDTAIAVPYSAATQVTDCKMRLFPTRLPGQVVRTGPYTGTIMVTVSVP